MKHIINKDIVLSMNELIDIMEVSAKVNTGNFRYQNNFNKFKDIYKKQFINKYIKGREFEGNDAYYLTGTYRDGVYFYTDCRYHYFIDVENYSVLPANAVALAKLEFELEEYGQELKIGTYVKY